MQGHKYIRRRPEEWGGLRRSEEEEVGVGRKEQLEWRERERRSWCEAKENEEDEKGGDKRLRDGGGRTKRRGDILGAMWETKAAKLVQGVTRSNGHKFRWPWQPQTALAYDALSGRASVRGKFWVRAALCWMTFHRAAQQHTIDTEIKAKRNNMISELIIFRITKAKAKVKFGVRYLCRHECQRSSSNWYQYESESKIIFWGN